MSFVPFKMLPSLTVGNLPAPIFNTVLAIGDTMLNIFGKLQGLFYQRATKLAITTTATNFNSLSVQFASIVMNPPNTTLKVGDVLRLRYTGIISISSGVSANFSIRVQGTFQGLGATGNLAPASTITNCPFVFDADITITSTGSYTFIGLVVVNTSATTVLVASANTTGNSWDITSNATLYLYANSSGFSGVSGSIYTASLTLN